MEEQVKKALDTIRGYLQADGGDVEFVELDEAAGIVKVRLTGACGTCPMAQMTLQMGVERAVKQHVPEINKVVAVPTEE